MYYHFLAPTRLESWHPWSPKATWTNTTRITKSTALKRGTSRKRHKLGYGRIVVVMLVYIFMLSLFWPFSYSLMQFPPSILKLSTQHPPYFFKLSTQHQPAITHIENWAILPTQGLQLSYTLIRAFSKISAYTKTVQFYSTRNTSMNKFLAQSSSPCLMLGGIPPASLSEGWVGAQFPDFRCAFPICSGVEAVKQPLNSIETNQGLFHSLNAHRHNANKYVLELNMKVKFKVNQAPN